MDGGCLLETRRYARQRPLSSVSRHLDGRKRAYPPCAAVGRLPAHPRVLARSVRRVVHCAERREGCSEPRSPAATLARASPVATVAAVAPVMACALVARASEPIGTPNTLQTVGRLGMRAVRIGSRRRARASRTGCRRARFGSARVCEVRRAPFEHPPPRIVLDVAATHGNERLHDLACVRVRR